MIHEAETWIPWSERVSLKVNSPKRGGGRCYPCGLEGRKARDPECKARLATCMKCKNVAHFVKVCKKREKDTSRPKKGHNVKPPKMTISPLPSKLSRWDVPTVDIELGGVRLKRVIDRATWEILKKKKKKKKKKKAKCISRTSNRKLYSYGSNEPLTTACDFESELC